MTVSGKRKKIDPGPASSSSRKMTRRPPTSAVAVPSLHMSKPKRDRARSPEDFKTSILNIRVKTDLKAQASATLEQIGISLPEAVRVFLGRVVSEQAFPFPLEVPNAETAAALRESKASEPSTFAKAEDLFNALQKAGER